MIGNQNDIRTKKRVTCMRQSVVAGRMQESRNVGMTKTRTSSNLKAKRKRSEWLKHDIHIDKIGKRHQRSIKKRKTRRGMKNIRRKDTLTMEKMCIGRRNIRIGYCLIKNNMKSSFYLMSSNIIKKNILHGLGVPKEKPSMSIQAELVATRSTGQKNIDPTTKRLKKA